MPFYLTKTEKRALLIVSAVIISGILIEWFRPHQINTKIYDYSLQDSLFKALSARPAVSPGNELESTKITSHPNTKKTTKFVLRNKSINLNSAPKDELIKLPRIGPKMAERIIEYRKIHGPFKSIESLKKVKGIGEKTLLKLTPYITVK